MTGAILTAFFLGIVIGGGGPIVIGLAFGALARWQRGDRSDYFDICEGCRSPRA